MVDRPHDRDLERTGAGIGDLQADDLLIRTFAAIDLADQQVGADEFPGNRLAAGGEAGRSGQAEAVGQRIAVGIGRAEEARVAGAVGLVVRITQIILDSAPESLFRETNREAGEFRISVLAEGQFAAIVFGEGQRGRRQKGRQVETVADAAGRQFEVAARARGRATSSRNRAIGAEGDVDAAGFEGRNQRDARNFDIADQEGRNVGSGVLDDDDAAVGLFENKVVAVDLDVVDRDAGRQVHDIGSVSDIFGLRLRRSGCARLGLDRLAGTCVDGNGIGLSCRLLWRDAFGLRQLDRACCRSTFECTRDVLKLNTGRHRHIPLPNWLDRTRRQSSLQPNAIH
ncbi:hypothetical protein WHT83_05270 [Aminobacter sp. P9b]|uniref:hypothetical protein n=1 Tax=Aminobacter sp. P9b TaxID=3133697 RepID=UPI00324C5ED0